MTRAAQIHVLRAEAYERLAEAERLEAAELGDAAPPAPEKSAPVRVKVDDLTKARMRAKCRAKGIRLASDKL